MKLVRSVFVLTAVLSLPFSAGAQQPSRPPNDKSPVSLGIVGGLSSGSGGSGGAIGATVAAVLSDRLSLEGRGVYLDRGPGADALDVNVSLLVNLLTARRAVPYVAIGGGIYRASFDLDNPRFFGVMGNLTPGSQIVPTPGGWGMMGWAGAQPWGPGQQWGGQPWGPGQQWGPAWMMGNFPWNGTTWNGPWFSGSQMPMFYANRLGAMIVPSNGRWGARTFTDPAVSFGGGVRFDINDALYVRPDVRALMVIGDGDTFTVGSFSVGLGYRF